MPELYDFELAIKADDIDREPHEKSVDARRGLDPKTLSGVQTFSSEQAEHSRERSVRQLNPVGYGSSPGCVRSYQHERLEPGSRLGVLLFATIGDESEHGNSERAGDSLDNVRGEHYRSSFPLNLAFQDSQLPSARTADG
jgi:hypothetical protein